VGETPLPIPNRAVKPHSADGTWPSRAWESRSPPVLHHEPLLGAARSRSGRDAFRGRGPARRGHRAAPSCSARRDVVTGGGDDPGESARAAEMAARGRWSSWRPEAPAQPACPSSQTRRRRGGASVASCPAWVHRGDADLCAEWGRSRPAPARVTAQRPAVRVLARGGGGVRVPGRLPRRCLAQRRERRGRVYGLAHQLAERALLRAACGRRGEHVFVRLGRPSDGTRTLRSSVREAAQIWLRSAEFGRDFCNRSCIRPRPDEDRGRTRGRGERVVGGAGESWRGRTRSWRGR
jgi:hypothetical protein